jgi:hypothetical protein
VSDRSERSERPPGPPASARLGRGLGTALACAGWLLLLLHATRTFAPGGANVDTFNSDAALPVLMANGDRADPYRLFLLGQDRFGAWPFLLLGAVRWVTGVAWEPGGVAAWAALFLFLSVIPLGGLLGRGGLLAAVAFLLAALAHPAARYLFQIDQVFPWQVGALAWAWLGLRGAARLEGRAAWRYRAVACAFAALACWTSPVSGPILAAWAALEWVWARREGLASGRTAAWLGAAVASGVLTEVALRLWRSAYAVSAYGDRAFTSLRLDTGHLLENWSALLRQVGAPGWWPWALVALVAAADAVHGAVSRREAPLTPLEWHLGLMVAGCAAAALAALGVAASVSHVRDAGYHERYITLVHLFGTMGGLLAVFRMLAQRLAPQWHLPAVAASAVLGVAVILGRTPDAAADPAFRPLREAAAWVASEASPSRVVVGGYWETYVLAGLADGVAPVPEDGEPLRMPWLVERLRAEPWVLLSDFHRMAGPAPAPWVVQHGALLQRVKPEPVFRTDEIDLWRYANRTASARPVAGADRWSSCESGSYPVEVESGWRGGWLVVQAEASPAPRMVVAPVPEEMVQEDRVQAFRVTGAGGPLRLEIQPAGARAEARQAGCAVRAWLVPDGG